MCKHGRSTKAPKKKKKSWGQKKASQSYGPDAVKKSYEQNVDLHLPSSQADKSKLVHSLNHSRSLQIHFQMSFHSDKLSFLLFIIQCCSCQTVINHFI